MHIFNIVKKLDETKNYLLKSVKIIKAKLLSIIENLSNLTENKNYKIIEILRMPKVRIPLIIVVYTVLVVSVTVNLDRKIISHRVNNAIIEIHNQEKAKQKEANKNVHNVEMGEIIDVDGKYSLSIFRCVYNKKITPSGDNFNSYYNNTTQGNIYLDVIADCANLTQDEVSAANLIATTITHGNNNYSAIPAIEINDNASFEYAGEYKIKPGETVRVHFISDVPAYIENDGIDTFANIVISGHTYMIKAYEKF